MSAELKPGRGGVQMAIRLGHQWQCMTPDCWRSYPTIPYGLEGPKCGGCGGTHFKELRQVLHELDAGLAQAGSGKEGGG
ncbi:MAG: hypothetical protein AAB686_03870 [Patescibacteria group bacterium]